MRSLLGRADLDTLLAHREDLNRELRTIIDKQTEPWGVQVRAVESKDVEIPESMQRAMAREAEAERERRAKVINARDELQASEELHEAAETLPIRIRPSSSPCRSTGRPRGDHQLSSTSNTFAVQQASS